MFGARRSLLIVGVLVGALASVGACDSAEAVSPAPSADVPSVTPDASSVDAAKVPDAAAPEVDAAKPSLPLRIAVLSDLNGAYGDTTYEPSVHEAVSAIVDTEKPDVVLVAGDMVAGQKAGLDYAAMWSGFHAAVTDKLVAAGIPVAPVPGNHDASAYAGYADERAEYERQWKTARVPAVTVVDGSHFPFFYSFSVKGTFFVAIDATTIAPVSDEQRAWIDAQLAASNASVRIVYGHVPLHPTTIGRETEVLGDPELESVLSARGAIFVGGHHHGYFPGVANGLRHVVTPCVGAGPRALIGTSEASARGFVVIDVADGHVKSIDARTGAGYASNVARASLPKELVSGEHKLTRDDLAGF